MEYRIRKQNDGYVPEYNHKTLYGVDVWKNIGEYNGYDYKLSCKTVDDARMAIHEFHDKSIKNTRDDESSVVERFNL